MLDLRLLNASISDSYNQSAVTVKGSEPSTLDNVSKDRNGVDLLTFKESPKTSHRKLKGNQFYNANPLHQKYGLEVVGDT